MLLQMGTFCAGNMTAPQVPQSGAELMPEQAESFAEGVWLIFKDAVSMLRPDLAEAAQICLGVIAVVLLVSVIQNFPGETGKIVDLTGAVAVSVMLLGCTNALIALGTDTIGELTGYGKLLLPVLTSAMAAQGGVSGSAALYTGTVIFDSVLGTLISRLIVPLIHVFLALSSANCAVGEGMLEKLAGFVKWIMVWCLKIVLYVFTGYMSITGVVSGTTDAAALKAAKLTISGMVPVVGGILSDASEAVLVSAGVVKNTAGIYGLLAVLAVVFGPFLRIGVHYLLLKASGAVCEVFGSRRLTKLVADFTTAMGLVLAMTGSVCLLLLISTVCFLRGMG